MGSSGEAAIFPMCYGCVAFPAGSAFVALGGFDEGKFDRGDDAEAERLFREAADAGDAAAKNNLGRLLRDRDDAEAERLLREAGDADGEEQWRPL
ncbi:hypothetical protein ACQCSU_04905 [Pseudarthrobacter sp. O4]|uniref:hypothetical protein n=1 Tax=Pseudarthrobacter sp. O4 TaxID=3418417 RepID=UPI003CF4470E